MWSFKEKENLHFNLGFNLDWIWNLRMTISLIYFASWMRQLLVRSNGQNALELEVPAKALPEWEKPIMRVLKQLLRNARLVSSFCCQRAGTWSLGKCWRWCPSGLRRKVLENWHTLPAKIRLHFDKKGAYICRFCRWANRSFASLCVTNFHSVPHVHLASHIILQVYDGTVVLLATNIGMSTAWWTSGSQFKSWENIV